MNRMRCHISISADGFVAGPNQSEENPLGEGGERLHDWIVPLAAWREAHDKQGGEVNASARVVEESRANIGAGVMGRNMFGPVGGGDWGDGQGKGWGDGPKHGRAGGGGRGGECKVEGLGGKRPAVPQRRVHPHPSPARTRGD